MSANKINEFFTADWITQAEAARMRGVSRQAIHKLVKKGRINTIRVSNVVFVERKQIEDFKILSSGRPKKNKDG